MTINNLHNQLTRAYNKYRLEEMKAQALLEEYMPFEFFLLWQAGDGLVVVADNDEGFPLNAGLDMVIELIKQKGKLTLDDLKEASF